MKWLLLILLILMQNLTTQAQETMVKYTLADTVLANTLYDEGVAALNKEQNLEYALQKLTSALQIELQVRNPEHVYIALLYNHIGICYSKLEKYDEALEYFNKALMVREKAVKKNNKEIAWLYNNIGNLFTDKSEYKKAIEYHNKALDLRLILNDSVTIATSYYNLGIAFYYLGEYNKAIYAYHKCLQIRKHFLDDDHLDIASTYNSLGVCYNDKGDYEKSMFYHKKCLDIRLKKLLYPHPRVASSYNNIGALLLEKKDYDKAITYFEKSLNIRTSLSDTSSLAVAQNYSNLAIAFNRIHVYKPEYLFKALHIFKNKLGEEHPYTATVYENIGTMYLKKKEIDKAIYYVGKAYEIRLKILDKNHPDIMFSLNNFGYCYDELKDYTRARQYYQDALALLEKNYSYDKSKKALFYNNIASTYKHEYKLQEAITHYRKSVALGDPYENIMALTSLIQVYDYLYENNPTPAYLDTAYNYAQQALAGLNAQLHNISTEDTKAQLLKDNYQVYENAIQTTLAVAQSNNGDSLRRAAFNYAEQSKAAILRARIKESEALHFAGIPDSLLDREHDLRIDLTWREKQRRELLDAGQSETDSAALALSAQIFDLKQQYDTLQRVFEDKYRKYYELKYQLTTIGLEALQQRYLSPDQTLLEYFVGDSAIYVFVINKDDFHVAEVEKSFPLDSLVVSMRKSITDRYHPGLTLTDAQRDEAPAIYCQSAYQLYEKLVAPVKDKLKSQLIIIPDGILSYVPFEALLLEPPTAPPHKFTGHRYLVRDYAVHYCYSATLWKEMRDKQHQQHPAKSLLGMAPYFTGDTTLLNELFAYTEGRERKYFEPLLFAGIEVANIAKLFDGDPLYGDKASKQAFDSLAANYRIVHLSTHGEADDKHGDYSYLAFGDTRDSLHSSLLFVRDLYNYSLNADMVTLSACETGIGQLQRGEGVISLARAFSYAGAKSIVTSLWSVNDKKTQELMVKFYSLLDGREATAKDKALRQAKLHLIKKSGDPYYWAGFVLIGDAGALQANTNK